MIIILLIHNSKTKANNWYKFKTLKQLKYNIYSNIYIKSLLNDYNCSGMAIVQLNRFNVKRLSIESIINTPYKELNNLLQ